MLGKVGLGLHMLLVLDNCMLYFELILNSLHGSKTAQNATEWNQSVLANTRSLDVYLCFNICSRIASVVIIFLFTSVIVYINFHNLLFLLSLAFIGF